MSERTATLMKQAADERKRLYDIVNSVEEEVNDLVDWRSYVRRSPLPALGAVAAVGVVVGMMTARGRGSSAGSPSRAVGQSTGWMHRHPAVRDAARQAAAMLAELVFARAITRRTSQPQNKDTRQQTGNSEARGTKGP
jgi:hypothetical protein